MSGYYGAGKMDRPAKVLELRRNDAGSFEWVPVRSIYAAIEFGQKKNIFSEIGVGARDASLVVWRQNLTLHNAIRFGDNHLFLTSITERNRNQLDVKAAICSPVDCQTDMDQSSPGIHFPGILTEKYVASRHEQLDPYAMVTANNVLVTPKAVKMDPGSWVRVGTDIYQVLVPHELDEWKNEYEIQRKADC